jgi:hypothetical protein
MWLTNIQMVVEQTTYTPPTSNPRPYEFRHGPNGRDSSSGLLLYIQAKKQPTTGPDSRKKSQCRNDGKNIINAPIENENTTCSEIINDTVFAFIGMRVLDHQSNESNIPRGFSPYS